MDGSFLFLNGRQHWPRIMGEWVRNPYWPYTLSYINVLFISFSNFLLQDASDIMPLDNCVVSSEQFLVVTPDDTIHSFCDNYDSGCNRKQFHMPSQTPR
jgi:hypothetical protein